VVNVVIAIRAWEDDDGESQARLLDADRAPGRLIARDAGTRRSFLARLGGAAFPVGGRSR
jgi:hypothetical protein